MKKTMEFSKIFIRDDYKVDWKFVEGISEFARLKECEQNPKWHSEGSAWEHTVKCVHSAYTMILDSHFKDLDPRIAIAAVLFHDIGKGTTTNFSNNNWHSYGHEFESEKITRRLLCDDDFVTREILCACARNHMKILRLYNSKNIVNEMINMSRIPFVNFRYMLFVSYCDTFGSVPEDSSLTDTTLIQLDALYDIAENLGILDGKFHLSTSAACRVVFPTISKNKPKFTAYVLIGLPGAGKNTYAEKNLIPYGVKMVSRDDIRVELGLMNEGDKLVLSEDDERKVTEEFNKRVLEYANAGSSICFNNLNIKKKYRDAFKQILNGYDVRWEYIYVEAPAIDANEECRPTFKPGLIRSMMQMIDWPQPDEYDEILTIKREG